MPTHIQAALKTQFAAVSYPDCNASDDSHKIIRKESENQTY
jgi:hypothetical protein